MQKKLTNREKINMCLCRAFFRDSKKYLDYEILVVEKYSDKCGGEYIPKQKLLLIQKDDSGCMELQFATVLHELAHHIEYTQIGYTRHDALFLEIQRRLLNAAFDLKLIKPDRLLLAEEFLSRYTERKRVQEVCERYMEKKHWEGKYNIVFSCNEQKGYRYSPVIECWYRFERKTEEWQEDFN